MSRWLRLIAFAGCIALAVAAGSNAIGGITEARLPAVAAGQLGFGNAPLARQSELAQQQDPASWPGNPDFALARASLADQPLNPRAVRIVGLFHERRGDAPQAAVAMRLAMAMSREDLQTNMYFTRALAASGDLGGAMHFFDITLRTSASAREAIFPVLDQYLADPQIAQGMAGLVVQDPPWLYDFFEFVLLHDQKTSELTSIVMQASGMPKAARYRQHESYLLGRLAAKGAYSQALAYFSSLSYAPKTILQTAEFDAANTDQRFAPLSWNVTADDQVLAAFNRPAGRPRSELQIATSNSDRHLAAHKVMYLDPGVYSVAVETLIDVGSAAGSAGFEASCLSSEQGGKILAQLAFDTSGATPRAAVRQFTVPAGCPTQAFDIFASSASDDQFSMIFRSLALKKVG